MGVKFNLLQIQLFMEKSKSQLKIQASIALVQKLSDTIKEIFTSKMQKKMVNKSFKLPQKQNDNQISPCQQQKKQLLQNINGLTQKFNEFTQNNCTQNEVICNYQALINENSLKQKIQKLNYQNKQLRLQLKSSKSYIKFLQDYNTNLKKEILIWMNQPKDYIAKIQQQVYNSQHLKTINQVKQIKLSLNQVIKNYNANTQIKKLQNQSKSYQSTITNNKNQQRNTMPSQKIYLSSKNQETTADKQTQTNVKQTKKSKLLLKKAKELKELRKSKLVRSENRQKIGKNVVVKEQDRSYKSNLKGEAKKKHIQISQFRL